jgi:hypothetical protein
MGAVDESLGQVELACIAQVFRQGLKHFLEDTTLNPALESTVHRLIGRVAPWEVCPLRARAEHP